jgi:hypothetical protein
MAGYCATLKTLTITFTPPAIAPATGYTVQWRVVGDVTWNTVTGLYSIPITIPGVPNCFNLEGTVMANCASGTSSPIATFGVLGTSASCHTCILLDTAEYLYVPCGTIYPIPISNTSGAPTTICAVDGTIEGGAFTNTGVSCS